MRMLGSMMAVVALATVACSDGPTGLGPSDGDTDSPATPQGTLVGTIEQQPSSSAALGASMLFVDAGIKVAAARVTASGTLEVLASASAAADGSYRIEGVPADADRLVVVATSGAGAEIGQVIVHQAVADKATATAAPINAETTVEARVFAELVRQGTARDAVNTVELAQSIEFTSRSTAEAVAASAADVRAMAEGVKARDEVYTTVLASRGISLDGKARFQAELPAAVAYAQERHAGTAEAQAEARAAAAVAQALEARGVDVQARIQASGAAETGFLRASGTANDAARLELARAAAAGDLEARKEALAQALVRMGATAAQAEAAREAVAAARARIQAAASTDAIGEATATAAASVQATVESNLTQSGRMPALAQERLKTALQNLPSQATLESRLSTASDAGAVAQAYVSFLAELRSAVLAAASQAASAGGSIDGQAMAELFSGIRGTVQVP